MKKIMARLCLFLAAGICASACRAADFTNVKHSGTGTASHALHVKSTLPDSSSTVNISLPDSSSTVKSTLLDSSSAAKAAQPLARMFIYEGRLYKDTGEVSTAARCGVLDGKIKKTVSAGKTPAKELQSNFGKGYGFQYGTRSNRLEVCIGDTWHIFACNENNLPGVSMKVKRNTAKSAVLTITNTDAEGREINFGEDFLLEQKNAKTGEWRYIPYKADNIGFHCIAYLAGKNAVTWKARWKQIYGELKPGTYRIVKKFMDFRGTGDYTEYTLSAEFRVEKQQVASGNDGRAESL